MRFDEFEQRMYKPDELKPHEKQLPPEHKAPPVLLCSTAPFDISLTLNILTIISVRVIKKKRLCLQPFQ